MVNRLTATIGALAIMMGSGAIIDFEVVEAGSEIFVRVWSPHERDDTRLRKHVAAILPRAVEERHVVIMN
jgi:hypothetical protein